MKKLSELADVSAGIIVNRYQAEPDEPSKPVHLYRAAQCVAAVNGQLPAPQILSVKESFHQPKKELRNGDILIPSRFTHPGCGIIDLSSSGIYASGNIYVIRSSDPVVSEFLGIYFSNDVGKSAISAISKEVSSYHSYAINAADLREMIMPELTQDQMLKAIRVNRQISAIQSGLERQSNLLRQLISQQRPEMLATMDDVLVDVDHQMLADAQVFLRGAQTAGMVTSVGKVRVAPGKGPSMIKTASDVFLIENTETGGLLVARDDEILIADGLTPIDREKFGELAAISTHHIQRQSSRHEEEGLDM